MFETKSQNQSILVGDEDEVKPNQYQSLPIVQTHLI